MNTLSIIEVLTGMLLECEERFNAAETAIESPRLKPILRECANDRRDFQAELRSLAVSLGGTPEPEQFDVCFPAALTDSQSPGRILAGCERADAAGIVFYERALRQHGNPDHAIDVIHKQYRMLKDSHERVRALRMASEKDEALAPQAA